ncbi:hypothetical protein DPMN_139468 [Dreissena polymorpha]|uniref:Uncharacterized protein n=1 Tax=Dreissena polymorpha TaxID=45954 RepID=A0A9D4G9K7_DREPO|nr:hypothetical protein DPMN_139468 [Dreissena polymorpha]
MQSEEKLAKSARRHPPDCKPFVCVLCNKDCHARIGLPKLQQALSQEVTNRAHKHSLSRLSSANNQQLVAY